jgi:glycosyltransferase involved in cell wall biosynthesis
MPLISVILPAYNVEEYIERSINSALNQTSKNLELIVIDDASTDNTLAIIERLLQNQNTIAYKLIRFTVNKGQSAARNEGIKQASGEYLYFLDADDWINDDAIAYFEEMIQKSNDWDILVNNGTLYQPPEEDLPPIAVLRLKDRLQGYQNTSEALNAIFTHKFLNYIWLCLFKKEMFSTIRFPEGLVWEDLLVYPYLFEQAKSILFTDKKIYNYCLRSGSTVYSFQPRTLHLMEMLYKMEIHFFYKSSKYQDLYKNFVFFKTYIIMSLSMELYTRASSPQDAHNIHREWSKYVPIKNIITLYKINKKRSAVFMLLLKYYPGLIGKWHKRKKTT